MNKVAILDFGSQYTQLIARKIRELGVFSEIFPFDLPPFKIKKENPDALVISGGPQSVYQEGAPLPSGDIFKIGIPVLGICYGLQLMAHLLGGKVVPTKKREYGFASIRILDRSGLLSRVQDRGQVWMSHGDRVEEAPPGFIVSGETANCHAAVIEQREKKLFGVQFHPEVMHTKQGKKILSNFLFSLSGLKAEWSMGSFIERKMEEIRRLAGEKKVICGLSGGVDSLVTSLIVQRAIEDRLFCVFVDNGLLRKGQYQGLMRKFKSQFGLNVIGIDASRVFLERLKRVTSPERKRKIIGEVFIRIFEKEAERLGNVSFLAQGTIYPDVIESNPVKGPSSRIKSHHNVGGLPPRLKFKLIEPLNGAF